MGGALLTAKAAAERRRLWAVTSTLAATGFKLRYFGSALGYMWSLLRPLLVFGVLYLALTQVLKFGNTIPHYAAFLIMGLVLFEFFSGTTSEAVGSLVAHQTLIRKVALPPLAIPLSVVLRQLFDLGLKLIIVGLFLILSGVPVTVDWLQFPILLGLLIVMCVGLSGLLATLFVSYRDTQPIWEVIAQLMFWASPIVYTIDKVPHQYREVLMLNPFALILTQVRHSVIDNNALPGWAYLPSPVFVLIPVGLVALTLIGAVVLYRRQAPRLAEEL